ncbi:hypothetical protein ACWDG9_36625 [Streptomyces sp. NPDC001073]
MLASPAALLQARYDAVGHLRLTARSALLATAARREFAERLYSADPDHLWHGRRFSAGWGTRDLDCHPVRPDLVAEPGRMTCHLEGRGMARPRSTRMAAWA